MKRAPTVDASRLVAALRTLGASSPSQAVQAPVLARALHMDAGRPSNGNGGGKYLRDVVAAAVRNGAPIGSSGRGYFLTESPTVARAAAEALRVRARALLVRAAVLERQHGLEPARDGLPFEDGGERCGRGQSW